MVSLVSDNIVEILKYTDHLERLLFASTCHQFIDFLPIAPIPIDKLLFRVIATGSVSLYQYYDDPKFSSVWNFLLDEETVLAHIGRYLPLSAKKYLLDKVPETRRPVVLDFAVLYCCAEELNYYFSSHGYAYPKDLDDVFVKLSLAERPDIKASKLPWCDPHIFEIFKWTWQYRHGIFSLPSSDCLDVALKVAIRFASNELYIRTVRTSSATALGNIDFAEHFDLALEKGNVEMVKFILVQPQLPFLISMRNYTFKLATLSTGLVESALPVLRLCRCTVKKSDIVRLWGGDQRKALILLLQRGCSIDVSVRRALFGDWIESLSSLPMLSLREIIEEICKIFNLAPGERCLFIMPANRETVRQFFTEVVQGTPAGVAFLKEHVMKLGNMIDKSSRYLATERAIAFLTVINGVEELRGCLRGRVNLTKYLDFYVKKTLSGSITMEKKKKR